MRIKGQKSIWIFFTVLFSLISQRIQSGKVQHLAQTHDRLCRRPYSTEGINSVSQHFSQKVLMGL